MRFSNAVLGTICGLMSLFWGIVWLNNVYLSWIKRIWRVEKEAASQITGMFPSLDIFSIDHSTVSTFIPFFGLAWMTWGFYKISRYEKAPQRTDCSNEFPFFSGYNEWMVSLGLMGTVWGLIMIGYLPDLENLKLTDLIGALRTALFSTLTALIWVYIIVLRIARPGMQWLATKHTGLSGPPVAVDSLQTTIEKFAANLERLNAVLVDSTQTIEEFRKKVKTENIDRVEKGLTACMENLPKINDACDTHTSTLEEVRILCDGLLAATQRHSSLFNAIAKSHLDLNQNLTVIKDLMSQKDKREARKRQHVGKMVDVFREYIEK